MCVFILFSPSSLIIHINVSLYDTIYCTTSIYSVQLTMDDVSSETCLIKQHELQKHRLVYKGHILLRAATKLWSYYYDDDDDYYYYYL